jgi:hypothetical protein
MTTRMPAERTLPHKQEILERVLAEEQRPARRRGWMVPVAAAASIAVVAGGALTINSLRDGSNPTDGGPAVVQSPAARPSVPGSLGISIDRGRLTEAQAAQAAKNCLKWFGNPKVDGILHPTLVSYGRSGATVPAFAVRSGDRTYTCVGPQRAGGVWDAGTRRKPLETNLGWFGASAIGRRGRLDWLMVSGWTAVDDGVASVRRRVVANGKPAPWYVTKAVDGIAYVQAQSDQVLRLGDKVTVETQQLDESGRLAGRPSVVSSTVKAHVPADGNVELQFNLPR